MHSCVPLFVLRIYIKRPFAPFYQIAKSSSYIKYLHSFCRKNTRFQSPLIYENACFSSVLQTRVFRQNDRFSVKLSTIFVDNPTFSVDNSSKLNITDVCHFCSVTTSCMSKLCPTSISHKASLFYGNRQLFSRAAARQTIVDKKKQTHHQRLRFILFLLLNIHISSIHICRARFKNNLMPCAARSNNLHHIVFA